MPICIAFVVFEWEIITLEFMCEVIYLDRMGGEIIRFSVLFNFKLLFLIHNNLSYLSFIDLR